RQRRQSAFVYGLSLRLVKRLCLFVELGVNENVSALVAVYLARRQCFDVSVTVYDRDPDLVLSDSSLHVHDIGLGVKDCGLEVLSGPPLLCPFLGLLVK